ncbi:MAG: acetyl-CoA carboxylase biotin carboxyl carrier protein subunit [Bacteroidetes bacterium]|nr:MAG: acetyl-CoA carboxylase biotin carboxyl carrier protein subunit [Bacteroidota bacterium]
MSFEVKINNRTAHVELLQWEGSFVNIKVDGKEYKLDFEKVNQGIFSILHDNNSYNIELIPGDNVKKYTVNTYKNTYEAEIIDAEAKYRAARLKGVDEDAENTVVAPIPGKVVKIPVSIGDSVEAGQTLVIFSAMKMESEFKAKKDGVVKEIRVNEGDTVEAKKVMVVVE